LDKRRLDDGRRRRRLVGLGCGIGPIARDRGAAERLTDHVGVVVDGDPMVVPTVYGLAGDTLYLHGSSGATSLLAASRAAPICVTVTRLDGVVYARSAFHHSLNYASAVIHATARAVINSEEVRHGLRTLVEHLAHATSPELSFGVITAYGAQQRLRRPRHRLVVLVQVGRQARQHRPQQANLPAEVGIGRHAQVGAQVVRRKLARIRIGLATRRVGIRRASGTLVPPGADRERLCGRAMRRLIAHCGAPLRETRSGPRGPLYSRASGVNSGAHPIALGLLFY